jgi:hypothetical protein
VGVGAPGPAQPMMSSVARAIKIQGGDIARIIAYRSHK